MIVYGMIPARSGSKGLPDKNIREIKGHPLLAHAVAFGKKLPIDRVFVSTDSEKYRSIAVEYGAECPVLRGEQASGDKAMEEDIIADCAEQYPALGIEMPDVWVWLKPTSPFRKVESVSGALEILNTELWVDSARIVSEADARIQKLNHRGCLEPAFASWPYGRSKCRRTEMPKVYKPFNLEVFRHSGWQRNRSGFMGTFIKPVIDNKITGFDIDDLEDFEIARALIEHPPDCIRDYIHL